MFLSHSIQRFLPPLLLIGLLTACAVPAVPLPSGAATGAATEAPTGEAEASSSVALRWQGPAELGSPDTSKCASFEISGDQATLTACDGTSQTITLEGQTAQEWAEIQKRFGAFSYDLPTEGMSFFGTGTLTDLAAQRAVLAWARARYGELSSGRVSAAGNTVMSWHLGQMMDRRNTCRHLVVLAWGYAYAQTIMCEGQDVIESTGGWLEPEELAQLDQWIYERATLYLENNYLAGVGEQAFSASETAAVEPWAMTLWERLWGAATAQSAEQPAACPVPSPETRLLVEQEYGYCLLYPADYTVERTTPNDVNLVRGSLMNHTDPRVSILAEDAAGRTLSAVADQFEEIYGLPGMEIERGSITIDGVEAVVLDNLPGQDLNRRVLMIHNGRFYSFFFTPLGEPGEARMAMETFYQGVLDSFRFLEETVPSPTPDPTSVEVIATDVQFIQALANVNIRNGPGTDYMVIGRIAAGQTAAVTGVTADEQWWRVICPDGSEGNCFAVADSALTQPATAPGEEPPAAGPVEESGDAVVESLEVQLLESFPVQANAVLRGYFPDACTTIASYDQVMAGPTIRLRMTTSRTGEMCAQVITPFEQIIPLNVMGLPAGDYDVRINELVAPFALAVDNVTDLPPVLGTDVAYVMAQSDVTIHAGPSADEPVIGSIFGGMTAQVTGTSEDGAWWRVICPDGTDGSCWVSADPALTQPTTAP